MACKQQITFLKCIHQGACVVDRPSTPPSGCIITIEPVHACLQCPELSKTYCQQLECLHSSLPFWPYYMSSAYSISMPCTCVNSTTCNQLKVLQEPEIQAPRGKERQRGVGTFELLAVCIKYGWLDQSGT